MSAISATKNLYINKVDNGYTVSFGYETVSDSGDSEYVSKEFVFLNWDDLLKFIKDTYNV
jgi:hypothetical protein